MTMTLHRRAFALAAAAFAFLAAPLAHADPIGDKAEAYVQEALDEVVAVLQLEDMEAKKEQLRVVIEKYIDTNRVAQSTLGKYRRSASREQLRTFVGLFKEYAIALYEDQIVEYGGERFKVTGSVVRSERDIIVNSEVLGGADYNGTIIQWRVYNRDGEMSIIDVGAENIWLGVEQQSAFTSFIADNGGADGGIDALIDDLRRRVADTGAA